MKTLPFYADGRLLWGAIRKSLGKWAGPVDHEEDWNRLGNVMSKRHVQL